jgi:SAM-dependent methyltransferase
MRPAKVSSRAFITRQAPSFFVAYFRFENQVSIDHLPGPFTKIKATVRSCAYSERISCNTAQIPTCGGEGGSGRGDVPKNSPIFVAAIATTISIKNGTPTQGVKSPKISASVTGLSGTPFAGFCKIMTGVDISSRMLAVAKAKNIYLTLFNEEIVEFLASSDLKYDFFIASDVFNYLGNLAPVFSEIKRCSLDVSYLVFSTETAPGDSYELANSGRFRHSDEYVHDLADKNGFTILAQRKGRLREENQGPVEGTIFLLKSTGLALVQPKDLA